MATKNMHDALVSEIRAEMGRQRKTQTELSNIIHLSQRATSYRLNGERTISWDEAFQAAQWLGISLTELVRRAEANRYHEEALAG